jgi:Short-chain dehydrogenases of various substrate specificities
MTATLKPLAQQVIVLTGACGAIGVCTAQLAAQRGAKLVLVARSVRVLDTLAGIIRSGGGEAICLAADVAARDEVIAAARAAVARFGRIDTWINNAGVAIYGRLDQVTEADSRHLFDVNFWGAVNGSLAALPYLLGTGGALINVGSELAGHARSLQGMYSSSKHALKVFTDALRTEVVEVDGASVAIVLIEASALGGTGAQDAVDRPDAGSPLPAPALDPMRVAEAILRAAAPREDDIQPGQPDLVPVRLDCATVCPDANAGAK